jgi:hypothetical protein
VEHDCACLAQNATKLYHRGNIHLRVRRSMIKLQLLLRHPGAEPELDPALCALLASHGLTVTCAGRASVSATVSEPDFARLFGPPPPMRAGFAAGALTAPALAVPPALLDAISLITIAPRHIATNPSSQE